MTEGYDFTPPVKGGYEVDKALHVRNWRALVDWLRTQFVDSSRIKDASITNAKIADAAIDSAKIGSLSVDKLTGGTLSAEVVVSGSIVTDQPPNQRVELDNAGIRAFDDQNAQSVNIPTAGSPYFRGTLVADAIAINGNAIVRSIGNLIDTNSEFRMAAGGGIADPVTAPVMSWEYEELALSGTWESMYNSYFDQADNRFYSTAIYRVYWYDATSGVLLGSSTLPTTYYITGIVKTSTSWWLGMSIAGKGYLKQYPLGTDFLTPTRTVYLSTSLDNFMGGLAWDAVNQKLIVAYHVRSGGPNYTYVTYWDYFDEAGPWNPETVETPPIKRLISSTPRTYNATDIHHDGTRLWVCVGGAIKAFVPNYAAGTIAEDAAQHFDSNGGTTIMGGPSGFLTSMVLSPLVRQFESWNDLTSYVHARYTWYDSVGLEETLGSKQAATIAYVPRARLAVSVGSIPAEMDRFRLYLVESGSVVPPSQLDSSYKLQVTSPSSPVKLTGFNSSGDSIPVVNDTSGATVAGAFASNAGGFVVDGDGKGAWPYIMPPGTILLWGGSTPIPDGFLACNGGNVSRTTYADLFAAIGTTFGAGDGSTTFGVPVEPTNLPGSGSAQWIIKF